MGRNQANDQSCANSPRRGEARCGMLIKEKWQQLGDTLTARTMWGRRVTLRGQMQVSWMKERYGVMGPATRTL